MPAAQTMTPTTDDFAAMLEDSFAGAGMIEGRVVPATVIAIANDFITVDVGLKTEGRIPTKEFGVDETQPDQSATSSKSTWSASRTRSAKRGHQPRQGPPRRSLDAPGALRTTRTSPSRARSSAA